MIFVPFVPPPPPSPRAQELGRRLRESVDDFKRDNPGLTGAEIRQAMHLAMQGQTQAGTKAVAALAVGLALLALVGFLLLGYTIPLGGQTMIIAAIIAGGILLTALAFIINIKNR